MNKQSLKTLGTALVLGLAIQAMPAQAGAVDVEVRACSWIKNTASCDVRGWLSQLLNRFGEFG